MTTVRITNHSNAFQASKFYIELFSASIKGVLNKSIVHYAIPKDSGKWTEGPTREAIELLDLEETYTVTCYIDKESNNTYSLGTWTQSAMSDARQVLERLGYMIKYGGTLTLYLGLSGDGYSNDSVTGLGGTYSYEVIITRLQWDEVAEDYSSNGTNHIASKYTVIIEFTVATGR